MNGIAARKTLSSVLLLAGVAWAANVAWQVMGGAGPPIAALCVSVPAVLLLLAAGAAWPPSPTKRGPSWFFMTVIVGVAAALIHLIVTYSD